MKESKCGKIPPCYGSLEFAIYEEAKKVNDEWKKSRALHGKMIDKLRAKLMEGGFLDDTHDKVYELNRQMCDIDKHLSEAGYFGMICEGQVEARKKLKDMEEKKINPMTKAEAFEFLKGKKIMCYAGIANAFDEPTKVEKFLLEIGCRYHFANHIGWRDWYWPLYGFIVDSKGEIYLAFEDQRDFFKQNFNEPISADDILSIEIVEEKKGDERKGEILDEIAKLGEKISDLIEEYDGDIIIEIDQHEVLLRNSGDILYRK